MGVELYFTPGEVSCPLSAAELVDCLTAAGFPCREEIDEYGHWIVFQERNSTINLSGNHGVVVLVTFDTSSDDPAEFLVGIERRFAEMGWENQNGWSDDDGDL